MVSQERSSEKEGQEMTNRYDIATNKYTKKELDWLRHTAKERRLTKKKTYKNYTNNQQIRSDPNVRKIRNGEVISTWDE